MGRRKFATIQQIGMAAMLGSAAAPAGAAVLFYDGFAAGGATPTGVQYQSDPASTNGVDRDSLIRSASGTANGQSPPTPGFVAGTGWRTTVGTNNTVYPRVNDAGLTYSTLPTVAGAAEIFRSGSNASAQDKSYFRGFAAGTGTGATDVYVSALVRFDDDVPGGFRIDQATGSLQIGFNAAGQAFVGSATSALATSTSASAPGVTHLLVARVTGTTADVWLNPTDFTSEAANGATKVFDDVNVGPFAAGTAFTDLVLFSDTGNGVVDPNFLIDEVRGATTWQEAFVPEPSAGGLAVAAGAVGLLRRRGRGAR